MKKSLKLFATSKWFDLLGVVLVVSIAIASGYLNSRLDQFVNWDLGQHSYHLGLSRSQTLEFPCYQHDLQENSANGEITSAF